MAGYFDGDGCIHAAQGLSVIVASGDKECVQVFADCFGGNVRKVKPRADTKRQMWQWSVCGWNAQNFLYAILFHLKSEKRGQAFLALWPTFGSWGCLGMSDTEKAVRDYTSTRISAINKRVTVELADDMSVFAGN